MKFEYLYKIEVQESIDIEDIGNCAIDAYNDLGYEWMLLIVTHDGNTEIIEYVPILPDLENYSPSRVSCSYERMQFRESKVSKVIDKFLNDSYKGITQVFEISPEEIIPKIKNLTEFLYDSKQGNNQR